jgi:HEAT repeat protein
MNLLKRLFGPNAEELAAKAAMATELAAKAAEAKRIATKAAESKALDERIKALESIAGMPRDNPCDWGDATDNAYFQGERDTYRWEAAKELVGILIRSKDEESALTEIALNHKIKEVRSSAQVELLEFFLTEGQESSQEALIRFAYDRRFSQHLRESAIASITSQPALVGLAEGDPELGIRLAAIAELLDEPALDRIATNDAGRAVRGAAHLRLCELTMRGSDAEVEALNTVLMDAELEDNIRAIAARRLGAIRTPKALDALVAASDLEFKELGYKQEWAWVTPPTIFDELGRTMTSRAFQMLFKHLRLCWARQAMNHYKKDPDTYVRFTIDAFNRAESDAARYQALDMICAVKTPAAIDLIVVALKHADEHLRMSAINALRRPPEPYPVEPVIQCLDDPCNEVICQAAYYLGEHGDCRAIGPLSKAGVFRAEYVRKDALKELSRIEERQAVESLISALRGHSEQERASSATKLGKIGDPQAVLPLIEALADESEQVRACAAKALGEIRDRRAVEPLKNALKSGTNPEALAALAQLDDPQAKEMHLRKLDPGRVEQLIVKASEGKEDAIKALGQIPDHRAVEPLIKQLLNENRSVREKAAISLGRIGDRRAIEPLRIAVKSRSVKSSGHDEAHVALGGFGDPWAIEKLVSAAIQRSLSNLRKTAIFHLGQIGDVRAVEPLIALLNEKDRGVREATAEALGNIGDNRAVESLTKALGDEDISVRMVAAEALARIRIHPAG